MSRAERRRVYDRTLAGAPAYQTMGERVFRALWRADHLGPMELRSYWEELQGSAPRASRRRRRKR